MRKTLRTKNSTLKNQVHQHRQSKARIVRNALSGSADVVSVPPRVSTGIKNLSRNPGSIGTTFAGFPLPGRFRTHLRYAETTSLTTGAAGVMGTQQQFLISSLFKPNFTAAGHQPSNYAALVTLYQRYRVDKVRVTLVVNNVGGGSDVAVGYNVEQDGTIPFTAATLDQATENGRVSTVDIAATGNNRSARVTFDVDCSLVAGIRPITYRTDPAFSALTTASPTKGIFLTLAAGSYNGTAGEAITVQTILDFQVEMFDRNELF